MSWSTCGCLCKISQVGKLWVYLGKVYSNVYFCFPFVTCFSAHLQHLVNLFARLANDNIGYIDWDPYIPKVCCPRFLQPVVQSRTCLFCKIAADALMCFYGLCFITSAARQRNKLSSFSFELAPSFRGEVTCITLVSSVICVTNKHKHTWPVFVDIYTVLSPHQTNWLTFFFTSQIFTRILRSLNLPVGTGQMMVPRYITNAYDISHVVLWVSSLLVRS